VNGRRAGGDLRHLHQPGLEHEPSASTSRCAPCRATLERGLPQPFRLGGWQRFWPAGRCRFANARPDLEHDDVDGRAGWFFVVASEGDSRSATERSRCPASAPTVGPGRDRAPRPSPAVGPWAIPRPWSWSSRSYGPADVPPAGRLGPTSFRVELTGASIPRRPRFTGSCGLLQRTRLIRRIGDPRGSISWRGALLTLRFSCRPMGGRPWWRAPGRGARSSSTGPGTAMIGRPATLWVAIIYPCAFRRAPELFPGPTLAQQCLRAGFASTLLRVVRADRGLATRGLGFPLGGLHRAAAEARRAAAAGWPNSLAAFFPPTWLFFPSPFFLIVRPSASTPTSGSRPADDSRHANGTFLFNVHPPATSILPQRPAGGRARNFPHRAPSLWWRRVISCPSIFPYLRPPGGHHRVRAGAWKRQPSSPEFGVRWGRYPPLRRTASAPISSAQATTLGGLSPDRARASARHGRCFDSSCSKTACVWAPLYGLASPRRPALPAPN